VELSNQSRGEIAYTMMDVEKPFSAQLVDQLSQIEGVFRVRVVKNEGGR
jgi:hypothetical protein